MLLALFIDIFFARVSDFTSLQHSFLQRGARLVCDRKGGCALPTRKRYTVLGLLHQAGRLGPLPRLQNKLHVSIFLEFEGQNH